MLTLEIADVLTSQNSSLQFSFSRETGVFIRCIGIGKDNNYSLKYWSVCSLLSKTNKAYVICL